MRYHIISIGGSAMHGLAIELHKQGHIVTGSDDEIFEPSLSKLRQNNLLPEKIGWFPEKITKEIDAVIVGMHAKIDNPEYIKAKELNIKCYSYPEFIYEQSKNKQRIVIAGSYGKTTITAVIMHVLKCANVDFDYVIGSYVDGFDNTIRFSAAPLMVIEGDEYLSAPFDPTPKINHYKPHIALINGISWDHVNVFETFEKYVNVFSEFIDTIIDNGTLLWNENDEVLATIVAKKKLNISKISYNILDYLIEEGKWKVKINKNTYPISLIGEHNIINIAGAYEICRLLKIDEEFFFKSLATFKGANKRLQKIYDSEDLVVFLDFAHSPAKVKATIEAVKKTYPNHTIIACLELHTYSSLQKHFLINYKGTMSKADKKYIYINPHVFKLKNYPIIEADFINKAFDSEKVKVYYEAKQLFYDVESSITNKSVILLMSSGNFNNFDFNSWINDLSVK
ncbi:MAG: Mur ligase family protein [Bacteroidales bacterium]|nr:Mur ligase family protein [Bacteroidales bacterium]